MDCQNLHYKLSDLNNCKIYIPVTLSCWWEKNARLMCARWQRHLRWNTAGNWISGSLLISNPPPKCKTLRPYLGDKPILKASNLPPSWDCSLIKTPSNPQSTPILAQGCCGMVPIFADVLIGISSETCHMTPICHMTTCEHHKFTTTCDHQFCNCVLPAKVI